MIQFKVQLKEWGCAFSVVSGKVHTQHKNNYSKYRLLLHGFVHMEMEQLIRAE